MSVSSGSSLSSSFFLNDSLKVNTKDQEPSYLIKGDEIPNPKQDSYEHIGGDDDIFLINGPSESFQLHRKTLKDALLELKNYSHQPLRNLDSRNTESFRSIVEALRLLYGSQALYDIILSDIRSIFGDIKDIKPGTVAAFFIGCFNDDKFPGPMGCSPKCAASLPPTEGTPGYANCDDLVLIYNGLFSSLNEKRSSHAYIYIETKDFTNFTPENINQLKDAAISHATLIFGNEDGSYSEVTSSLPVDQLPVSITPSPQVTTSSSTTTSSSANLIFFILLVAVIVISLVVLFKYRNSFM